tara:strand:+ start:606 stop:857 length:252 start_codon:yes stop_codon:yes gene_type:complete
MYHPFQSALVIQVEELTTLVVVAMVTLPPLDPIAVQVVVEVPTVVNSTQVDTVVTDLVDPSTSTEVGVTDTDLTIPMETTLLE